MTYYDSLLYYKDDLKKELNNIPEIAKYEINVECVSKGENAYTIYITSPYNKTSFPNLYSYQTDNGKHVASSCISNLYSKNKQIIKCFKKWFKIPHLENYKKMRCEEFTDKIAQELFMRTAHLDI
jgi:hypothetical protein